MDDDWETAMENEDIKTDNNQTITKNEELPDNFEDMLEDDINTKTITNTNKNSNNIFDEEETLVKKVKENIVVRNKNEDKALEEDYEKKYQESKKKMLKEKAAAIALLDHLDEETKQEKIKEIERMMQANILGDDDEEDNTVSDSKAEDKNKVALNFNHKDFKIEVENDFAQLAFKLASKIKADKKYFSGNKTDGNEYVFEFLKNVNLKIAENLSNDMKYDFMSHIKVIQNKKKNQNKNTSNTNNVNSKNVVKSIVTKKNDIDNDIEINPEYQPRNAKIFDDFM